MLESGFPSKTFFGVRFALVGFNPIDENTLRSKLLSGGGVDIGQYNQSCTHLIVDKLVYDDPICVAARSSGKVVVTGPWVDHCFDIGMLIDVDSVLYRPLKDLNGIPGAKSLIVCLTGYQRQDREDIMTMVDLMGGQFSKPLVANRVTHLICYKFEGEKYELAKRMKRIKLVNHRWLEDCLKNWKLLPEANYEISGYELEMMEASARDSEDEAEDASTKRVKTSPLGLRVSAVETPKSIGKDIPIVQTNSGSSKDNWLTPKRERSLEEATVSTDAVVALNHAPTIPLNKTPELETDYTTASINRSIRRHSSLASYSRQTPEESSGLKASTAFNVSASKSGISLFQDLDKIDKSHDAKFTEIHRNSEASIPLAVESRPGLHRRPVPSIDDPTEIGEFGNKSPASGLATKPLSSDVVAMEGGISTARDKIVERSLTEPLQEQSSHSPKQNLKVVPSVTDHTEAALNLDLSDSAAKLLNSSVVPTEADIRTPENTTLKVASDEVAERSITESVMSKSGTATGSGLVETKEKLETELPKKKTAPRKTLGTRGRKKNPINLKGSIYLSEPTPKEISSPVLNTEAVAETAKNIDSEIEALKGNDSADKKSYAAEEEKDHLVSDLIVNQDKLEAKAMEEADASKITMIEPELNDVPSKDLLQLEVDEDKRKRGKEATSFQSGKKGSSSIGQVGKFSLKKTKKSRKELDTEANDNSANEKESLALEDKLEAKTPEVEITMLGPELNDVPSDSAALELEVDKNKRKRGKETTSSLQSRMKKGGSTYKSKVGNFSVKKTKKSKKEDNAKANDIADEKENLALEDKSGEDQSAIAEETLAREEAETEDPSDAAMQSEVEKNKGKRKKEASGKKGSVKKTKNSKTGDNAKAEVKEKVNSDGAQSPVTKKPSTRKETSDDAVMQSEVDKNKGKRGIEGTVEKISLQSRMKKASSSIRSAEKIETADEKENVAMDTKSLKSSVSRKPKEASKSAKTSTKAAEKESKQKQLSSKTMATTTKVLQEQEMPKCFIVSGPKAQRNEYQKILRRLKGKCCRDSHQWSYQATHFIAPEIKRTEKFFAAASSGSWILKTDYVADSKEAGKLLPEEPYEWHSTGLSSDGSISLESPRKWRLAKEKTGHGALYGLRIVVYGDCSIPSLDTLKRAVKAGDGTILATAPPYTRFLNENTDFALISPGMLRVDAWVQEFIRHEIPCVLADYIVEYVCKPGYALDKHVLYNTNSWAERSFNKLQRSVEEKVVAEEENDKEGGGDSPNVNDIACEVCGSKERGEVMLICGDEEGLKGCGIGTHIYCCVPPLTHVPDHDWFCSNCSTVKKLPPKKRKKKVKC